MADAKGEITRLVERWNAKDESALDRLVEVAYEDLRRIARHHVRRMAAGETIGTTALVNELYLKLAGVRETDWGGRAQFFAFCSKAMRRILIDHARRHRADKRGGEHVRVPLSEADVALEREITELLALDQALDFLAERDARLADIVECRFFGGLSVEETAEALGTSSRTVVRDWARARAYLHRLLSPERPGLNPV